MDRSNEDMMPAGLGHNRGPELTLADQLKEDHAETLRAIDALADKANKLPPAIDADEAKATATDVAAEAAKLWKEFNGTRVRVKAPFKEAVDTVDGFFRDPLARLDRIDKGLMARVTAYDRAQYRKAQEAAAAAQREADRKAEEARKEAEAAASMGRTDDALAALEEAVHHETAADTIAEAAPTVADATRVTTASGVVASGSTEWTFEVVDRAALDLNAIRDFFKAEDVDAALKRFVKINKGTKAIAGVRFFEDVVTRRRRG